jgi:hypothetical protein
MAGLGCMALASTLVLVNYGILGQARASAMSALTIVTNALMAIAVARSLGVGWEPIRAALAAFAALQGQLDGFHDPRVLSGLDAKTVRHHVQHLAQIVDWHFGFGGFLGRRLAGLGSFVGRGGAGDPSFALGVHPREPARAQPGLELIGRGVGGQLHGDGDDPAWVAFTQRHQLVEDGFGAVVFDRLGGLPIEQLTRAGEQQLEVVVQLGHGAHGRA